MITFKDLNWPLKTGIISAWIVGTIYFIIFVVSFIYGLTSEF